MENKQLLITFLLGGLTLGLLVAVVVTYNSGENVCFENKEAFFEYNKQTGLGHSKVVDMYNSCVAQQQKEIEETVETQVLIEQAKTSLCSESPTCVDDLLNDQSWLDKVLVEKAKGKTFEELDFGGRGMVHLLALESCYVEECLQEYVEVTGSEPLGNPNRQTQEKMKNE